MLCIIGGGLVYEEVSPPVCNFFFLLNFILFTNHVLCFTNLLEFFFVRGSRVLHLSLHDRNSSKAGIFKVFI